MREIKFRAYLKPEMWDGEHGKMFYKPYSMSSDFQIWLLCFEDNEEGGYDGDFLVGKDVEISQYTGIKDKNGKEIYEHDIVKTFYGVGYSSKHYPSYADGTERKVIEEVKYEHSGFDCLRNPNDENFIKEFEVIGNIFETPELLTVWAG